MQMPVLAAIILSVFTFAIGATIFAFVFYKKGRNNGITLTEDKYEKLGKEAKKIIEDAEKEGSERRKQLIDEAKKEIQELRESYNQEVKERIENEGYELL